MMLTPSIPRAVLALTGAVALISAGVTAVEAQAPTQITLKVKGTDARHTGRFCHKRKNVRVFRRGQTIEYKGLVTPPPAKHFPVTLRLQICRSGHFHALTRHSFQGKRATGRYQASFRAPRPGRRSRITYFAARVTVGTTKSPRRYFGVHR